MSEPEAQPRGIVEEGKQALEPFKKAIAAIGTVLVVVSHLFPSMIAKLDGDDVAFWTVFKVTAPLSLTFTFLALSLLYGWYFAGVLFPVVFLGITWVCDLLGVGAGIRLGAVWRASHGLNDFAARLMSEYFLKYGGGLFVAAIVVGVGSAFAWEFFIRPRLASRVDLAGRSVAASRPDRTAHR